MKKLKNFIISSEAYRDAEAALIDRLLEKYSAFMEMVLEWNSKVNLTAITDRSEFEVKHFIDSLAVVNSREYINAKDIIDVGTGAGFPGIPLAIFSPEKKFLLVDSLNKRIRIINDCIEKLRIENVTAVHGRAEDLGRMPEYRENFDICVSRAVSRLQILSEYCIPFVKKGGWFVSYKSSNIDEELRAAQPALELLGAGIEKIEKIDADMEHCLIYAAKHRHTPRKYPRRTGMPEKEPIGK